MSTDQLIIAAWVTLIVGIVVLLGTVLLGTADMAGLLQPPVSEIQATHPSWSHETCIKIHERKVSFGMTEEMVLASWGPPSDINRSVGVWGSHEQWVYKKYSAYLYFENGILTSYQN